MLRWQTAGESHGEALVAMIEGLPAGVHITTEDIVGASSSWVWSWRAYEVRAGQGSYADWCAFW